MGATTARGAVVHDHRSGRLTLGRTTGYALGDYLAPDLSGLGELFADDYVNHAALPGTSSGPAGQAELMKRLWHAFPDANFTIEYLAIDEERSTLICIGTMEGTHEGELMGISPTRQSSGTSVTSSSSQRTDAPWSMTRSATTWD